MPYTLIARRVIGFTRHAREHGFAIGVEESQAALRVLDQVNVLDPRAVRAGLRCLLCTQASDWRRFDDLFDAYWSRRVRTSPGTAYRSRPARGRPPPDAGGGAPEAPGAEAGPAADARSIPTSSAGGSRAESLATTDFRYLEDSADLEAVHALAARMAARMRWRMTRRFRRAARGARLDLRRTIHASLRHGGVPFELSFRERRPKPIKLVVLLDASGSMNLYSRFFLRFVTALVGHFQRVEAFVFHTRIVHLSPALREKNLVRAMERMSVMSEGWGGGTRIGECLRTFNEQYAGAVLGARSVVLILSDGYDTGEPDLLARQMQRLSGRARRIVWLNPLIGWRDYAPVARGMAAALPYVDYLRRSA